MDVLGIILMVLGSLLVYGAGVILKLVKKEFDDMDIVKLKSVGLLIVLIGVLRIFDVF